MKKQIVILLILSLIFTLCFGVSIAEAKTYFKSTESKLSKIIPQINSVTSTVNGMKISYKEVDKAEGYIVYKVTKSNGKNKYTKLGTTKNLYYYDTKAEYGKTYKYSVSAYYGDVKSKKSAVKSKKCTMEKGPELSGTFVFEDCIAHLKWTIVKNTEKYNIYRSTSKNSGYKKVATTENTYYDDEIRDLGFKYYYKVKPIIDNKEARSSNKFCADAVLEYPEIIEDECYEDGNGNVIIAVKPQKQVIGYYVAANSDKIPGAVNDVECNNGIVKFKKPAFSCSEYLVCNLYNIKGEELMGLNMFTPVKITEKPVPEFQILKAGVSGYNLDVVWNQIGASNSYRIVLMKDGREIYATYVEENNHIQIDFTNRIEGAYSVYVEAHSSRDIIKSATYSFFWKRPQEHYPNYEYDDYKPPIIIEPEIQEKPEIVVPEEPNCAYGGCNREIYNAGGYCIEHGCAAPGCIYIHKSGSRYCNGHTCSVNGCSNQAIDGYLYCKDHLCQEIGCHYSNVNGRYQLCSIHMRCILSTCRNYREPYSRYCLMHKQMLGHNGYPMS